MNFFKLKNFIEEKKNWRHESNTKKRINKYKIRLKIKNSKLSRLGNS